MSNSKFSGGKMNTKSRISLILIPVFLLFFTHTVLGQKKSQQLKQSEIENKRLEAMFSISSHTLFKYVKELSSEKYGGRLTGTKGYNDSAQWVADIFKEWGVKPAGDNDSFFQDFPNPYTLVLEGSEVILHIPQQNNTEIKKHYLYQTDFFPGSTSDTGEKTTEVIYVGYGITAPELDYDEYQGLDVKDKIVMVEREVPVSPRDEPEQFKKWRPYSFHQYKVKNAKSHGAAGMIYIYHIANPNCLFIKNLLLTYVGQSIVDDIFLGTGKNHKETRAKIKKERVPQSFKTGKIVTLKNVTQHYPEGVARNVLGYIEGSHPVLKKEAIVLSAHLDHLGYNHKMMPGANDNASGVAVLMGVAQAITKFQLKTKRSLIFAFFGAEEQGVKGSEYFLKNPTFLKEKIFACINLDGVGRGNKVSALAGENYPKLWKYFQAANTKFIHRTLRSGHFHNLARPRLDAAHFMWANIPTISFSTFGADSLPYATYHTTFDNPKIITPEIMEDLSQLILMALLEM
jgi:hypothetical protein